MDEHRQKVDREFDALLAGHSRELEALTQRQVKDHERQVKNAAAVEARRRRQLQQQQEAELKQFQAQQKKDYARWKDELRKVCVRTSYEEAARPAQFCLYSQTCLSGQHWDLIISIQLGRVSTYPCFILYTVSKRDQTNDIHLSGLST